jgi:hypothetical protein
MIAHITEIGPLGIWASGGVLMGGRGVPSVIFPATVLLQATIHMEMHHMRHLVADADEMTSLGCPLWVRICRANVLATWQLYPRSRTRDRPPRQARR